VQALAMVVSGGQRHDGAMLVEVLAETLLRWKAYLEPGAVIQGTLR
jgi:hypothetical protein